MTTIATTKEAIAAARTRMEKAVDDFRKELATVRTGRANAGILESIRVDFYGTPTPVNQLGTVTVPEPTMLVISPWDPSVVGAIDKAIRASDLGLNPTNRAAQGIGEAHSQSFGESSDRGAEYSPRY